MAKPAKVKEEAVKFFAEGNWDKALQAYNALTKLEPNDPKHLHRVGDLQVKIGRAKDAVETYKKTCEVYMAKGFLIQAIAMAKMVMQLDPTQKEMETKLTELYSKRGVGAGAPTTAPSPNRPTLVASQRIVAPQVQVSSSPQAAPQKSGVQPQPAKPQAGAVQAKPQVQAGGAQAKPQAEAAPAKPAPREAPAGEKKLSVAEILAMTPRKKSAQTKATEEMAATPKAPSKTEAKGPEAIELPAGDEEEEMMPEVEVPVQAAKPAAKKPAKPQPDLSKELSAPIDLGPIGGGMSDLPPMDMPPMGGGGGLPPMDMPTEEEAASEDEGVEIDVMGDEPEAQPEEEAEVEVDVPLAEEEAAPEIVEEPAVELNDEFEEAAAEAQLEELEETPPSGETLLDEDVIEDLGVFPDIPLFKDLGKDEFQSVVGRLQAKSISKGDLVVREGDDGDSIFILASGTVSIFKEADGKKIQLGTLTEGDFFGEFGYFSGAKRQASVEALEDIELLEMSRDDMDAVVGEFPSVVDVLEKFYQERVMENILATSVLFRDLSLEERRKISTLFAFEDYREGQDVVKEGDEGDAMYLIRSGTVSVHTTNPMGETVNLAELVPGDFFGEVSLVQGKPRTATVSAASPVLEVMKLGKEELDTIVSEYPEVLVKIKQTIEKRVEQTVNKVSILDLDENDLDMGSLL